MVGAIAMSEPGTGSDLQGVRTSAVKKGNGYVLNGSKTFITNGQHANLIVVVAKTDPKLGAKGVSLMVVETDDVAGFRRGRKLKKLGMDSADTSELFFEDVSLPAESLLGSEEGLGFVQLMNELPQERLIVAIHAMAMMERALEQTIAYVKERHAFGKKIIDFQNTQFVLARMQKRDDHGQDISRPLHRPAYRGQARHDDSVDGEVSAHRHASKSDRPLSAIVWRLWFHGRISDLADVSRRARHADLRRYERDHEIVDREKFVVERRNNYVIRHARP